MIYKSNFWYDTTALHLWRFYFGLRETDKPETMTEPNRLNYEACHRTIRQFSKHEIDVLRYCCRTGNGCYEDMRIIEDCARQNMMTRSDVWKIIKRANAIVIVERGLKDRKEDRT